MMLHVSLDSHRDDLEIRDTNHQPYAIRGQRFS